MIVKAAGNSYPYNLEATTIVASQKFDTIIVGSLAPSGLASRFSPQGKEVHILSPADFYITSSGKDGIYVKFGGTSGATPMVTGALATFNWLSGYRPTAKESKMLLEKTAIPTIHTHEKPQLNGVGMVNAYKLGMVGKRIGERCPKQEESCFKKEIANENNYIFKTDKKIIASASREFPACARSRYANSKSVRVNCNKKREAFTKIRKAALLNPERGDLWNFIACIYEEEGLPRNADGLKRIAAANSSDDDSILANFDLALEGIYTGGRDEPEIGRFVDSLGRIVGINKQKNIISSMENHTNRRVRAAATYAAMSLKGDEKNAMLNSLAKDPSAFVRKRTATAAAISLKDEKAMPILKSLAKDPSAFVRKHIASTAVTELKEDNAIIILKLLVKDPNIIVRLYIASTAVTELKEDNAIIILKLLAKDPNSIVRKTALHHLSKMKK